MSNFTNEDNERIAKQIADDVVTKFLSRQSAVSSDYVKALREVAFACALTATNKLANEIKYLRTGGPL